MARLMERTAALPPTSDPFPSKFLVSESPLFSQTSSAAPHLDHSDPSLKHSPNRHSHSHSPFQTGATPPSPSTPNTPNFPPLAGVNVDPKLYPYIARIAAYYQHRCETIVSIQQQRCMAWANVQRKRSLEMLHGSKLVVAWYIRDRIQRKRRHQKRKFNSGLKARATPSNLSRRDAIARWMAQITQDSMPPDKAVTERSLDKDEIDFTIGVNRKPLDQESRMLQTVDTLIRSQTKKFELPVLGALDLSESDQDSDDSEAGYGVSDDRDSMDFDDTTGEDFDDDEDWDEVDEEMATSSQEQKHNFGGGEVKGAAGIKAAPVDQPGRKDG